MQRTIDDYDSMTKREIIKAKQEKGQMYIGSSDITIINWLILIRRVQKFRTDYVELRTQFERLKCETAAAVRAFYVYYTWRQSKSFVCSMFSHIGRRSKTNWTYLSLLRFSAFTFSFGQSETIPKHESSELNPTSRAATTGRCHFRISISRSNATTRWQRIPCFRWT